MWEIIYKRQIKMEIKSLQEELLKIHNQLSKLRKKDGKVIRVILKKHYQFMNQLNTLRKK